MGSAPSVLSMVSETWARPSGGRPDVPAKMTSSILPPRRVLAPCSPMTQASASTTLDLPEPLGPTTAVTPGSKSNVVADANDLKPRTVKLLRCKVFQISIGGGSCCLSSTKSSGKQAGIPGFTALRDPGTGWELSPAAVARPRLAHGAGVGGTVHELLALQDAADPGGRAAPALLTFPAVGVEGPLEVAGRAVDIDVQRVEAGAAGGQGVVHHVAGGGEHALGVGPPEGVGGPCIVQLCPPQGLVCVDVADPGDEPLVQQCTFQPGLPLPEAPVESVKGKVRIQGVARDVRGLLSDDRRRVLSEPARSAVVRGNERGNEQAAEDPLVHEPQLLRHGS